MLIAINNKIPCQIISSPTNLELICVRLLISNPITICVTYIPPNSPKVYCDDLFNFLLNCQAASDKLIILGDFNFPDIDWDTLSGHSPNSNQFCDMIFQANLSQLIDGPTHIHGNILDLLLTNMEDNIYQLQIFPDHLLLSDHYNITFQVSTCYTSSKSTSYLSFNYTKGDYQGLHQHLLLCDFTTCYLSHDIELVWSTIEHLIIDAMQLFIPVRKIHANQHPPWFNSDIRHNIKQLRTLRRRYKQHPTHHISCTINSLELTLQNKINAAKQSFEYNLINCHATTNNNKIFKYLKSIRKSNNVPSVIQFESSTANTDCAKANLFNQYFHSVFHNSSPFPDINDLPSIQDSLNSITITVADVYEALISLDVEKSPGADKISPRILCSCAEALCEPLHHLFSLSLRYATLPNCWKVHKIVPVFKAGDHNSANNYRPISLLSNTSKVLERIIYNKIINHISRHISSLQFGFSRNCSTLQQMLIFLDHIINNPLQSDVIYFDISKAFDTVSHSILLNKLWSIGITGVLWACYLTNRYQRVAINNCFSNLLPVISGVPQGSILGPLLFLVYINDMPDYICHSLLLIFADDTKCLKQIHTVNDRNALQEDIDSLFSWSRDSDLNFNLKKCVHLSFKHSIDTVYTLSDITIPCNTCHKDLGIILSSDLNWSDHYKSITARAYKVLGLIRRTILPNHSTTTMVKLYVSLVRSQLLYCTQIWRPHLMNDILTIERVQRRATKYILNDYTSCYKTRLLKLNLLPLMYMFELQDLLFAIKSIKFPTNQFNINNYIKFSTISTRSGASNKLKPPCHINNTSRHSYFHRIPYLWNAMPIFDLNKSFCTLKTILKQYLWDHFKSNFDINNNCTFHHSCPCSKCHLTRPPSSNFDCF